MLSVCPHDCPSACSLVVTVEDGRLTSVTGNPDHPFTQGVICGKVREYAERVHSPLRVLTPLRRVGAKGRGEFEPISWDEAIDEIARRWRGILGADGAEAILPFSYAGSMGQVQYYAGHPFFHALGASRLDRTICVNTAYAGWRATLGAVTGNDSEQMVGADLVVLWGGNAAYSTINVMTLVKQARARGAFVVVVDPYRTSTAQQADLHLMVRPGTDAALALSVMHVLIAEGHLDRDYIERATLGIERLAEHVKAYSPEAVAPIVGLDAATIVRFARRYGAGPRTFIRIGIGISRHDNGGMTCRTLACLPALTGAYADPHGGALLSSTAGFGFDYAVLEHPDLYRSYGQFTLQLARPALPPQGQAKSNWEVFQLLARALGVAAEHYAKSPEALIREFLAKGDATVQGITFEELETRGWVRVNLPRPYTPFAHGAPTASGKVEFYSERLVRQGLPALPTYVPLDEGPENRELTARYPLQCLVPPNRFFLNSSFSQSALLRRRQGTPTVMLAPEDAERRGIVDGAAVTVESPRGAARFTARVTDATRRGVVVIEGIWWHRFQPDGRGVNVLTSDRVTDLGGGPAFHSNLVEVSRA